MFNLCLAVLLTEKMRSHGSAVGFCVERGQAACANLAVAAVVLCECRATDQGLSGGQPDPSRVPLKQRNAICNAQPCLATQPLPVLAGFAVHAVRSASAHPPHRRIQNRLFQHPVCTAP